VVTEKRCGRCLETKPVSQFFRSSQSGDGYHWICRNCDNAGRRQRRHGKSSAIPATLGILKYCSGCNLFREAKYFPSRKGKLEPLCRPCKVKVRAHYYREHKTAICSKMRRKSWQARLEMIAAYGGQCQCCGESVPEFLTIDHINGGGKKHRRRMAGTWGVIRELKRLGWPKVGYRLLCWNCNCAIGAFGVCPHQRPEMFVAEQPIEQQAKTTKRCPGCGLDKPIATGFFRHPSGASSRCKACNVVDNRERRQKISVGEYLPDPSRGVGIFQKCCDCDLWKVKVEGFHRSASQKANGFQYVCKLCAKQRRKARADKERLNNVRWWRRLRLEIVQAYGGVCECCGESRWPFLTIDHINNDGSEERRNLVGKLYIRLKKRGFPREKYRLLCYSCNCARSFRKICPHKAVGNLK